MIKYRLHWTVHPGKDDNWYKNECSRLSEDEIARELDINYSLSVSGKVFASFRKDRHVSADPIDYNPHLPVYRIWDFGKTNATLWGQIDNYGRRRILHERVLGFGQESSDSNVQEQARVVIADSNRLFPNVSFYDICDPAGSFTDHRGATPDVDYLVEEYGLNPQYHRILELPTRERKKRGRSLIQKDLQETPGGQEAFLMYVHPNAEEGCITLEKAFLGGYCYKKDSNGNITDTIQEKHPYEDVMDCLIYFYLETDGFEGGDEALFEPVISNDYFDPYTGL